jgi:alcohol dehydrogenase
MTNMGDIEQYLGGDKVKVPGTKKILVPTTAGSRSEVTVFSVLAIRESDNQAITGMVDKHLLPEWAIINPTLTLSMSPSLTANTGLDALSHAIESYLNVKSNFQTEPLALNAIRLLAQNIERAAAKGQDLEARWNVSAGSVLAGMSLCQTGGGLAHALAETIQIPYRIQHGTAIASILPHVMSYNLAAVPHKQAAVAKAMGVDVVGFSETELIHESVQKAGQLIENLGLPTRISELRIPEKDLKIIADSTMALAPGLLKSNPWAASVEDLLEILRKAY